MFWPESYPELKDNISQQKNNQTISDDSYVYLNKTLDYLNTTDWVLEDYESEIISQQIDLHEKLNELSQKYNEKVDIIHNRNKKILNNLFTSLEKSEISETHLLRLEWLLDNKKFEQTKNTLSDNINIQWWIRWMLDWIISLNKQNKEFIDKLSLFILNNNIDLFDENQKITITVKDFHKVLDSFTKDNVKNDFLPSSIEFEINNNIVTYNFEEKIQYFKEILNRGFLHNAIVDSISNKSDSKQNQAIYENYNIDVAQLSGLSLLNRYVENKIISQEEIFMFHEEWKISTQLLLNYLEQLNNFNYLEYLEDFPLPESIQKFSIDYVRNTLNIDDIDLPDAEIYKNMHLFVLTFLHIESSGRNIANQEWISSAKWYFQFLTDNWVMDKNTNRWNGSSFQTAINRARRCLSQDDFSQRFWWIETNKPTDVDPRNLSAENQTLLFLCDVTQNGKKINNKSVSEYMKLILTESNTWALAKVYNVLHHTNPDKKTKSVFKNVKNWYFYSNNKFIAKNHY